ncbi:hypothetical protein KDW65_29930 [Burkholderia cenocepacia]|uniref:hypothetical protein n=1 Tax=Burkholderia cenocepacia TaxID=95486 RepID=UPI001B9E376E|nr:hypothetical protein [Burkholderia cenocepacia]MBR8400846.1 hypothetical protein [Burkholderia cenocepacia]
MIGGIVLNIFWAAIAYRSVRHTIEATPFVGNVLDDRGEVVIYDVQRGVTEFERHHKEPSAIPKFGRHIVFGLAPLYLILSRLLSSSFGANGVLLTVFGRNEHAAGVVVRQLARAQLRIDGRFAHADREGAWQTCIGDRIGRIFLRTNVA